MPWPVGRRVAGGALAVGLGVWCAMAPAAAAARPAGPDAPAPGRRALIAFLPTTVGAPVPLTVRLGWRPELALGLTSPTLGGYEASQLALDLSSGARLPRRAYLEELGPLRLVRAGAGGRVAGWRAAVRRARTAPGEEEPGLLADSVRRAGGRVAYAGTTAFAAPDAREPVEAVEGVVAADGGGRVARVSLGAEATLTRRAIALGRRSTLLVARLPPDDAGLRALDALLAARRPDDLVAVLRAPPRGRLRLLPTALAGPGLHGTLSSPATRRPGLIAAPDLTATVLAHLRLPPPDALGGRVVETGDGPDASELVARSARLDVVVDRRWPTVRLFALAWLGLAIAAVLSRRPRWRAAAARLGLLGALWAPAVALVTAWVAPPGWLEVTLLGLGSLALGAATDRLLPWPRAPALPAAVSVGAHAIDLALGSPLIAASVVGPNPEGGGRFFGVGNELEIVLAASVLLGCGALLHGRTPRRAALGFGIAGLTAAGVVGSGRLGADAGGVLSVGAGAVAALAVLARRPGRGRTALALATVPAAALAAVMAVDLLGGGGAHLTATVADASGPGELLTVVERRARVSAGGLLKATTPVTVGLALAALAAGFAARARLLAPLDGAAGRPWRAGLAGTLAATATGALVNDSGPIILLIGVAALGLAVAYVVGRPPGGAGRPTVRGGTRGLRP